MKNNPYNPIIIIATWVSIVLYSGFFIFKEISLISSSLGHYIKEGEYTISNRSFLYQNIFSYIDYGKEVLNHDWGLGVFYYLLTEFVGFSGLHIILTGLFLLIWIWFLRVVLKNLNPLWMGAISILTIPLIFGNAITTANSIAFLLSIVSFLLVYQFLHTNKNSKSLWLLPLLQVIWINFHISFLIGWAILLLGILQAKNNSTEELTKPLIKVFIASISLSLLNPYFVVGFCNPLSHFFSNSFCSSSYDKNLWSAYWDLKTHLLLFALISGIITLASLIFMLAKKQLNKNQILMFGCQVVWLFTGFISANNIAFIGLASIANLVVLGKKYYSQEKQSTFWLSYQSPMTFLYILVPVFMSPDVHQPVKSIRIGIPDNEMNMISFFRSANIQGPIFNNKLASGYLIYGLHPQNHLYVNDRYGSHSNDFLESSYFPAVLEEEAWHAIKLKYDFNTIVFALDQELTPKLKFLGKRMGDGEWALVFHEAEKIAILLKRNAINAALIEQFEIKPNVR